MKTDAYTECRGVGRITLNNMPADRYGQVRRRRSRHFIANGRVRSMPELLIDLEGISSFIANRAGCQAALNGSGVSTC